MQHSKYLLAALLAGVASAALTTGALAQAAAPAPAAPAAAAAPTAASGPLGGITDPDVQILLANPAKWSGLNTLDQRGCATSDKVIGETSVPIDGYRYGGCLAKGADKNVDAVRVLIKASQSTGQFRNVAYGFSTNIATYLVIGDTSPSIRMEGSGTWQGEKVSVRMDWDYREPGVRLTITHANKSQDIWVAADPRVSPTGRIGYLEQPELFGGAGATGVALAAWKEKPAGVYAGPSDMKAEDLMALVYLMPWNVILEGRDAADKIKTARVGRNDVLTIPVAEFGGANLTARLDADGHPTHTELTANGHTYTGDFDNFLSDRGDYEVYAPHQVSLQIDGKPVADWQIDWHQANPYLVFPIPQQVAAAAK